MFAILGECTTDSSQDTSTNLKSTGKLGQKRTNSTKVGTEIQKILRIQGK